MRSLLFSAVMLISSVSLGADIAGTLSGTFVNFDQFGTPQVRFNLDLTCALSCTASAPGPHYGSTGYIDGYFASEPSTGLCLIGLANLFADVDPTGSATRVSSPPAGSRITARANGVTCWCGGSLAIGQGGFIQPESGIISIPPSFSGDQTAKVGEQAFILVTAAPRGSETVEVTTSGAGLATSTQTFGPSDFPSNSSCPSAGFKSLQLTPTQAGTLTITATLNPGAATSTYTVTVSASGSGGGGGSASTGGGSGSTGGGSGSTDGGCSAVPVPLLLAVGAWLARRRAQAPGC